MENNHVQKDAGEKKKDIEIGCRIVIIDGSHCDQTGVVIKIEAISQGDSKNDLYANLMKQDKESLAN